MNRELTPDDVWVLTTAGCNAHEIAAFAGVSLSAATAMIFHATRRYAGAA